MIVAHPAAIQWGRNGIIGVLGFGHGGVASPAVYFCVLTHSDD